jgi:hypothetical protein
MGFRSIRCTCLNPVGISKGAGSEVLSPPALRPLHFVEFVCFRVPSGIAYVILAVVRDCRAKPVSAFPVAIKSPFSLGWLPLTADVYAYTFLPSGRLPSQIPEFHALPVIQQLEDVLTRISSLPELDGNLDSTFF